MIPEGAFPFRRCLGLTREGLSLAGSPHVAYGERWGVTRPFSLSPHAPCGDSGRSRERQCFGKCFASCVVDSAFFGPKSGLVHPAGRPSVASNGISVSTPDRIEMHIGDAVPPSPLIRDDDPAKGRFPKTSASPRMLDQLCRLGRRQLRKNKFGAVGFDSLHQPLVALVQRCLHNEVDMVLHNAEGVQDGSISAAIVREK